MCWIEMLEYVLFIEDLLTVEELQFFFEWLFGVPQVINPARHQNILIIFIQFFVCQRY